MKLRKSQPAGRHGFTLIELLVVITLIGILAIAVLSALNPIEQINKARDARKRADSAQLLKAIDRYFASNEKFPWNNYDDYSTSVDLAFYGRGEMVGVGVCSNGATTDGDAVDTSASGCTADGYLITTQELKDQFTKRDYFKDTTSTTWADRLYIYKEVSDPSTFICFIPASKATRDTAGATGTALKDINVTADTDGIPAATMSECSTAPTAAEWAAPTTACYICIPEE